MAKYVAFLRGIMPTNPNMRNQKLRSVLESLGLKNVQSVIASGNLIFESNGSDKTLETKIETAWSKNLGINITTIIRSQQQLRRLVKSDPFKGKQHSRTTYLNVTFLKQGGQVFNVIDTASIKTPDLMSKLEKEYGKQITTRTWNTIEKVLKKIEAT